MTKARVLEAYDGVHYPNDVYDALVQVEVQSFDWALSAKEASSSSSTPPESGSMGNPILGLFMVIGESKTRVVARSERLEDRSLANIYGTYPNVMNNSSFATRFTFSSPSLFRS